MAAIAVPTPNATKLRRGIEYAAIRRRRANDPVTGERFRIGGSDDNPRDHSPVCVMPTHRRLYDSRSPGRSEEYGGSWAPT
jgi:hypothetical protein